MKEHSTLAHAIDAYHEAVGGGGWTNAEIEAFLTIQGRPAEDEDGDVKMEVESEEVEDVEEPKKAEETEVAEAVEELGERMADFHIEGGKKMSFDFT